MIRLMLIDDHGLIRHGLKALLSTVTDMSVVADGPSVEAVHQDLCKLQPTVILIPLRLLLKTAATVLSIFKQSAPQAAVLVLSNGDESVPVKQLFQMGIQGYLTNSMTSEELLLAIRKLAQGLCYVSPMVAKRLALYQFNPLKKSLAHNPFQVLSSREMLCGQLLVQGKNSVEISQQMAVTVKTVNTYRYRIFQKLQVSGEVEFVKLALQHGLVEDNESC